MNLLSLLPLLLLLLLGCTDDDDSQPFTTPTFCMDTDRYRRPDCTSLYKLPPEDHFAAVLGRWTFVVSVGTCCPITDSTAFCGEFDSDNPFIEFRADSTVLYTWGDGEVLQSRFDITVETYGTNLTIQPVSGTPGLRQGFGVICGNKAYFDDSPLDGPITLYVKTVDGRPIKDE